MTHRSVFLLSLSLALSLLPLRAADIGGTTVTTNTTLVDGDTWNAGNFGINNGALVNVPTGATLIFNPAADRSLTSTTTGTLQIDAGGTLSHATTVSGDNLILNGAVALINNGTYTFAGGGDFRLQHNSSTFTNAGLIRKTAGTVGGSNDPTYIFPNSTTTGGLFSNSGNLQVDAGHLNISGGSSSGGNFTTTAAGTTLSFSGRWTGLAGVSSAFAGSTILISTEDPNGSTGGFFTAGAATTILNVTGSGLRLGSAAYSAVKLDLNGNTLRNDGLLLLATGNTTVSGAGAFENGSTGTFQTTGGTLTLNGGNFTNNGLMTVATGTVTLVGTATVTNSGTLTLSAAGVLAANTSVTNNGQMNISGTTTISGSVAVTNSATGTLTLGGGLTSLTLNGNNVINNGTAQYAATDGNVTITGSGRFINNVTFNHAYGGSADNFILNGTAVFENNGTFDLKAHGDIQPLTNSLFENKGLVVKSVAGSDASYIFRDATGSVTGFTAAAGSELRSNAGVLHVAVGGTSDAAALWTADVGQLGIAGQWSGTMTGSSANAGRVRISTSGNGGVASNLLIGTGGLTVDISGDGLFWDQSTIGTQGNTLTNADTFTITGSGTKTLNGAGQFINAAGATLTHLEGTITFADGATLRNQGSFIIPTGATPTGYAGTGSVINEATGTVAWTGGTIAVASPAEFHNQGTLTISGTTHTLSGTGVFANDATGITNWTDASTITLSTGATYTNNGTFNVNNDANRLITGAGAFINNGTFNHNSLSNSGDNVGWNGTGQFTNNGLFAFNDNNDYQADGGTIFTNAAAGIIRVTTTDLEETQFFSFSATAGVGTVDNQGTVEVLGGRFRVTTALSGATFDSVVLTQNDGLGALTGGTWIANSTLTGTASIDLEPFGDTAGITTLGANAIVDLTGAGATLVQLSTLTQVDGGLHVSQKTFTQASGITVGSTGTLGGNGTIVSNVIVDGQVLPGTSRGADIGTLTITGSLTFNSGSETTLRLGAPLSVVDSSLTPAQMQVFINALPDVDPTTQHDSIDVSGILTLSVGMAIHVTSPGFTSYAYGQYFDLFDFASLSGITTQAEADAILNLPSIGGLVWDTSLFVGKGIVFVVPEPSRMLMVLLGGMSLLMRRRRH